MKILDRLLGSQEETYPLKVGEIYYNEDADLYFKVEDVEPYLVIMPENSSETRIVDKDIYEWKYQNEVIREPESDVYIIDHDS